MISVKALKWSFAAIMFLMVSQSGKAQISGAGCPNADFSLQNFTNWICYYGSYASPATSIGVQAGRHTIISGVATVDPNTCGGLLTLPPGSTTGARLGNSSVGAEAERMTYSLVVDQSNALFIYKYAVVLQDPSHPSTQQPKFTARLLDATGTQIGGFCGEYSVTAASGIPGFQTCGLVQWKDWATVGVNLSPWLGQLVTLEFTTYDCAQSGHYGYAYIAADCRPLNIDITYCPGDNSIELVAPPGFASYSWNTVPPTLNDTLIIFNPNVGDTLTVTMTTFTNSGVCSITLDAILVPTVIDAGFVVNSPCEDLAVFQDTSTVDNGNILSWFWDLGDNTTSTQQNPTHIYANPGTYTVTMIAYSKLNQDGCSDTITKQVTIFPKPDAGFTSNIACVGQPSQFTNTTIPHDTILSYAWNFGGASNPATSSAQDPVVAFTAPGSYLVTLVATNTYGCVDSITQAVSSSNFPSIDFTASSQCEGTPINFYDITQTDPQDSIIAWTWETGDATNYNTSSITHTYGDGGVYFAEMVVTSAKGCIDSITKPIQVYYKPEVDFSVNDECFNDGLQFNNLTTVGAPSSSITYQWDFGDNSGSTVTNPVHTYSQPDEYIVNLTAVSNHNCIDNFTDTIDAFDYPTSSFSVQNMCVNQTASFINSSIPPVDGTINSFSWDFGDGSPLNTTDLNPTHNYASPGNYPVTLINYSSNLACPDTFTHVLTVHPMAEADFSFNDTCHGKTMYFNDQSIGQLNAWTWDFGDNSIPATLSNTSHIFPGPGTYDVELLVNSIHGCKDSISQTVTVWPLPVPNFTSMNVCEGQTTFFYEVSSVPAPHSIATWRWDYGDPAYSISEYGETVDHKYSATGDYEVTLTVTSDVGCVDSLKREVLVSPVPIPMFSINKNEDCRPVCINFTNQSNIGSGDSIAKIIWDFGDGGISTAKHPQYCYTIPGTYHVELYVESAEGCKDSLTFTDTIHVHDYPRADFTMNPNQASMLNPVIYFNDRSAGATNYFWDFGDNRGNSDNQNPLHTYTQPGEYVVTLRVENDYGCSDQVDYIVIIEPDFTLYVPTAFSPNGDGVNDYFKAEGTGLDEFELEIYDRWGALVFKSDNIDIGWDGFIGQSGGSKPAQMDVYVYRISARNAHDKTSYSREGHFTLVR